MKVYIEWTVNDVEFVNWNYVGGGITEPVFRPVTHTRSVLYSSDTSQAMVDRANDYIVTDMNDRPDARVVIK